MEEEKKPRILWKVIVAVILVILIVILVVWECRSRMSASPLIYTESPIECTFHLNAKG